MAEMSDKNSTDVEEAGQTALQTEAVSPEPPSQSLPPEEGLQGWLCVVGAFLCLFCTFGFLNAIGLFQTTYQDGILRDYSSSDIAWIFAVQLALMWAPGPLFGRLVDTYGPAPVLYPCSLLCVFALAMTSLARRYYEVFLAQGLAFGLGAGGVFSASLVCVGQWFVRRRGLATGIATTGSSLGGVVFPVFFANVMRRRGFDGAVRYSALLIGVVLVPACLMVRARLPRKKAWDRTARWLDVGLLRDDWGFALFTGGAFLVMWGLWAPFDFLSSMAVEAGFSSSQSFYLISVVNATSVFGRTIPPHLADRFGHFNVITLCGLATGVSVLALWLPFNYHHSHAGIIIFALVYGFVSGAFVSLLMACVAKLGDIKTLGQRFGTFQMVLGVSCLTGLPIMGAILNRQHNVDFSGLQLFSGCACLLGSLMIAASTYLLAMKRGTWKV